MKLDKNKCHDIVHQYAGSAENCEYCQGKIDDKALRVKAEEIIATRIQNQQDMQPKYAFKEKDKIITSQVIEADEEGNLPVEIKVLPVGTFNTTKYGKVEIKEEHLDSMVKNFSSARKGIPIDTDHDGGAANGWVQKLVNKGKDGLWAVIEWTTKGKENLGEKIYKYFSPEFSFNHIDPETSKPFGPTFLAGTLTNRPLFKILPAIVANEELTRDLTQNNMSVILLSEQKTMNLDELRKKALTDLNDEEKAFIKENANSLTVEERLSFGVATDEEVSADKAKKEAEAEKKAEEEAAAKAKAEEEAKKANEGMVTIKASELEELKKANEAIKAKEQEAVILKLTEEAKTKFLANEKGGKVAPKAENALVGLYVSLNEDQRKMFSEVMNAVSAPVDFDEIGRSTTTLLTAGTEFERMVEEKMKADEKLSLAQAQQLVANEKPEAYNQYIQEIEK